METESSSPAKQHPIQVAAHRSGLTPAVLRAWERRYNVVTPTRGPDGHRLYSDQQIARLRALKQLSDAGRRIGGLAQCSGDEIAAILRADHRFMRAEFGRESELAASAAETVLASAAGNDPRAFARSLDRSALILGPLAHLDNTVGAVLDELSTTRPDQQSQRATSAMNILQAHLETLSRVLAPTRAGKRILTYCAGKERAGFGAVSMGLALNACDFDVASLAPHADIDDVALAVRRVNAEWIGIGVTHHSDKSAIGQVFHDLRERIAPTTRILVGGWQSHRHLDAAQTWDVQLLERWVDLPAVLSN